jgi:hypothetical protein
LLFTKSAIADLQSFNASGGSGRLDSGRAGFVRVIVIRWLVLDGLADTLAIRLVLKCHRGQDQVTQRPSAWLIPNNRNRLRRLTVATLQQQLGTMHAKG